MNKGLEALERIGNYETTYIAYEGAVPTVFDIKDTEDYDIIEAELKKVDELENKLLTKKQSNIVYLKHIEKLEHWNEVCEDKIATLEMTNKRQREILRIIKEKEVNVHNFKFYIVNEDWSYEQYLEEESDENTSCHQFAYQLLTQEEFDSLEEILR